MRVALREVFFIGPANSQYLVIGKACADHVQAYRQAIVGQPAGH